jgi:hypothetical protein
MAGCKSCGKPKPSIQPIKQAQKLESSQRGWNTRYPHILVGKQALYSDTDVQMIVTVVADHSDTDTDMFVIKPQRILKSAEGRTTGDEEFEITQPAGGATWKLKALI